MLSGNDMNSDFEFEAGKEQSLVMMLQLLYSCTLPPQKPSLELDFTMHAMSIPTQW